MFVDANNNGVRDLGEAGVAGAQIEIRTSAGAVVGTVATDADGKYVLSCLVPGDYTITIVGGIAPELSFLSKKTTTVSVLGESITNADFRVQGNEIIALTGSNRPLQNTGFAMMLVGLGLTVLLWPGTLRRRHK